MGELNSSGHGWQEVGVFHSTHESGEPHPWSPREGRGRRAWQLVAEKSRAFSLRRIGTTLDLQSPAGPTASGGAAVDAWERTDAPEESDAGILDVAPGGLAWATCWGLPDTHPNRARY